MQSYTLFYSTLFLSECIQWNSPYAPVNNNKTESMSNYLLKYHTVISVIVERKVGFMRTVGFISQQILGHSKV